MSGRSTYIGVGWKGVNPYIVIDGVFGTQYVVPIQNCSCAALGLMFDMMAISHKSQVSVSVVFLFCNV